MGDALLAMTFFLIYTGFFVAACMLGGWFLFLFVPAVYALFAFFFVILNPRF